MTTSTAAQKNGTAVPSFTRGLLEGKTISEREDSDIKWLASSLYMAGADTVSNTYNYTTSRGICLPKVQTVSAIYSLFIALAQQPSVLEKAQAEIDGVTGGTRLPNIADRSRLRYLDALCKEVLRWNAVIPYGIPHRSNKDDFHDGYFIPAGSIIFPNIENMLHDPRTYRDPYKFDPSRFLPDISGRPKERDPRDICFGFGRRLCPGMHLAESTVFIACMMIIAVFEVRRKTIEGVVVEAVLEKLPGAISHPAHADISVSTRSPKSEDLIRATKQ